MQSRLLGRTSILLTAALAAVTLASSAPALIISGGPSYTLPGGGSCTVSGVTTTGTGATVTCTGVNLAAHSNVYFGIRNDINVNGNTMTGATPSGGAVFAFSSSGADSITYTSSTSFTSLKGFGTQAVTNQLTLGLATGTAAAGGTVVVVATGGTPADNGNGAIQRLFKLTSGSSFAFTVDLDASSSSFALGQACPAVYNPAHVSFGGGGDVSKVDLAFYYSDCGDGFTDSPEQCDLGAGNGLSTTCCTAACTFRASGLICRSAAGVCDVADTCSGASATCPADGKSTAVCRVSAGVCDPAELCNGVGNNCPADAKSTAQCRASVGVCDVAEACDGVGNNCPADGFASAATVCRASGGVCDVAENCTGASNACPTDAKSTAQCRAAAGVCDVAEACNGVNNNCPTDAFVSSSTQCRAAGGVCDVAENCTGTSAACPADAKSTAVCRAAGGVCDVAESCDGVTNACPADAKSTVQCRAAAGACDVAELCDGVANNCPADALVSSGTECRAVTGACDVAETCDGVAIACPADGFASSGTECRAVAGVCDVAESCTGSGPDCPTDAFVASGTECRAVAGVCDVAEDCTGSSAACPTNGFQTDGTNCDDATFCNGVQACSSGVCGGGSNPCAMGQSCDEVTDACFIGSCPPVAVACRDADKNKVLIKNKGVSNAKNKLVWKWTHGADSTQGEFADPINTAPYALCFYAGTTSALIQQIGVPPSTSKWSVVGTKGYKYKDATGAAAGITKIIVKGGTLGKSKALVKGKGVNLPNFGPLLPIAGSDLPLIVQLRNNETGICWEGAFANPKKNLADQFNAKTP